MTRPPQELEDRLRRVLDEAAGQLPVGPAAWPGPSPARRLARPAPGSVAALVAVVIALLVGAAALVTLGAHRHPTTAPASGQPLPPAPATALPPRLSPIENRYITTTWSATAARDHACRPATPATLATGSPSRAVVSRFAILRRSATHAPRLERALRGIHTPRQMIGQGLYLNQLHLARTTFGASFYVIPAANVGGQRGVPARCGREQVAALGHRIARLPRPARTRILAAQARWLAYLRYAALHPEGVCGTVVPTGWRQLDLGDNLGCATLADFGRWGVLADADALLPRAAVFWTVVPDGVARVGWVFAAGTGGLRHPVRITGRAINNVAIARAPYHAPEQSGFPSRIELFRTTGEPIKTIRVSPTNMITLCGYGC